MKKISEVKKVEEIELRERKHKRRNPRPSRVPETKVIVHNKTYSLYADSSSLFSSTSFSLSNFKPEYKKKRFNGCDFGGTRLLCLTKTPPLLTTFDARNSVFLVHPLLYENCAYSSHFDLLLCLQ